ncbi:MAG: energy transducer TonB [Syntrophobacteraceae bacterium]
MESILDSFAETFEWVDEGNSAPASFLMSLELSADGLILPPAHKAARRELILGTGGAFLIHVLAAASLLLLPMLHPPRHTQEPFINVYFADAQGIGCSSSSAGLADGVDSGEHPEQSAPDVKSVEKEAAPDVPKAKTMGQAVAPAKSPKKTSARTGKSHTPTPESPLAGSRKIVTATKDRASEGAGDELGGGRVEGTGNGKEAGEGSCGPGLSNASSGTGLSGEFDAATVDKIPQILKRIDPVYPGRARSLGICGKVVVRFLVEPDGRVSKPSIVEAHPKGYFEQSTLEAVRHWQFKPGSFKGKDVATWVVLPVQFRLTEQD